MQVNEYRFLTINDTYNPFVHNWSRSYEWQWVFNKLFKRWNKPALSGSTPIVNIHNTCCGPSEIHAQFYKALYYFCAHRSIYLQNSDLNPTPINRSFENFRVWDILTPLKSDFGFNLKYDIVLCISTLEELQTSKKLETAFYNLYNQVNPGGQLLITCDYPDVHLDTLNTIIHKTPIVTTNRLTGRTSEFMQPEYSHLNVVCLDIYQDEGFTDDCSD